MTTDHEYGACIRRLAPPLRRDGRGAAHRGDPLPFEPAAFVERMLAAATPRTRLVFANHIASTTAIVFPVQAVCEAARRRGIATLIDGAHAPGQGRWTSRAWAPTSTPATATSGCAPPRAAASCTCGPRVAWARRCSKRRW
ncbi:MAG: aminotransferase class V-fold PLP-dependent enzyme [Rubrivivax sp.]